MRRLSLPSRTTCHLPSLSADLDDGAAMRGHLDVDLLPGQRRDCRHSCPLDDRDDAGEHQMRVGVFVVDHQQAVVGRAVERDVADIVVVVAELPGLGLGASASSGRSPARRQRADRPSAAARRRRSLGDMMRVVDAGLDFVEVKAEASAARASSAVSSASGLTVAAMAETASEPFRKPRREKRAAMISPMVGLSVGLCGGPSASSNWLVLKRTCCENGWFIALPKRGSRFVARN